MVGRLRVWGIWVEVGKKGFSREWELGEKKRPHRNAMACNGCNGSEVYIRKISFLFPLNPPLHNRAAGCCVRNLLLWAAINSVLTVDPPENTHWRAQRVLVKARDSISYPLHTTGHVQIIQHSWEARRQLLLVKARNQLHRSVVLLKRVFSSLSPLRCTVIVHLERPLSDSQKSATTTPSAVSAITFNCVCSTRSQTHMQYI